MKRSDHFIFTVFGPDIHQKGAFDSRTLAAHHDFHCDKKKAPSQCTIFTGREDVFRRVYRFVVKI
jgi:hypothetical protein